MSEAAEAIIPRRLTGAEYSVVRAALNTWGNWLERHSDYEGYPVQTNTEAFLKGGGGAKSAHRILCLDMPVHIYATHVRVILLPEHEQEAVWVYYVPRVKEDGSQWLLSEKLLRAGLSYEALKKRLQRAYPKILGV